jgi:hypothetical protein
MSVTICGRRNSDLVVPRINRPPSADGVPSPVLVFHKPAADSRSLFNVG